MSVKSVSHVISILFKVIITVITSTYIKKKTNSKNDKSK